jgi:hypothetical protein
MYYEDDKQIDNVKAYEGFANIPGWIEANHDKYLALVGGRVADTAPDEDSLHKYVASGFPLQKSLLVKVRTGTMDDALALSL